MLKVDRIAIIRHKVLAEGRSIRGVAKELGHSKNTVRSYVRQPPEPTRRKRQRRRPKMELVGPRIEALLEEWSARTTRKQRITGARVFAELEKEGYDVGITTVNTYMRERREAEAETFIPLVHRPGEAQVDFFDVVVVIQGKREEGHLFQMSLPCSDRDYGRVYLREDLPSFLDGHERAIRHFGRAPTRTTYDNLKLAVREVKGADRVLNTHFCRMIAHYGTEPDFTRPGEGHDKGAIEVRGKRTRLNEMVPIPEGDTLEEINETLIAQLDARAARRRNIEGRTVLERFQDEFRSMVPLPDVDFDPRLPAQVNVGRQSTVRIGGATYSVPSHWPRRDVLAWVGATDIRFECRGEQHTVERAASGRKRIEYLHYLPQLARRPHAVRQVAPELMLELGGPWPKLWEVLLNVHEPLPAARIMAGLLEAVREHRDDVEAALAALVQKNVDGADLCRLPVVVPEEFKQVEVTAAEACAYDVLLEVDSS